MAIRAGLREELLKLTAAERRDLAEALCDSLEDERGDAGWEDAWRAELEKRMADVTSGSVQLVDADEVHAGLRSELRRIPR